MLTVSLKALFMFPVSLLSVPPLFANLCLLFITFQSLDINKLPDVDEDIILIKIFFRKNNLKANVMWWKTGVFRENKLNVIAQPKNLVV